MNSLRQSKKIIFRCLSIIFLCFLIWNFFRINAFYFSYQKKESLPKQQQAFFKSVKKERLNRLDIQPYPVARSSSIIGFYYGDNNYDYRFFNEEGKLVISIYKKDSGSRLASLYLTHDLKKRYASDYNGSHTKSMDYYQKKSLNAYKEAFKKVYLNWKFDLF